MDPKGDIYDDAGRCCSRFAAWTSVTFVLLTAGAAVFVLVMHRNNAQAVLLMLAALWAVGAPLWFFVDYYYVYRKRAADDSWELFKHGQQVSIAIWAGFTAALYALGSSDLAKPPKFEAECMVIAPSSKTASLGTVPLKLECKTAPTSSDKPRQ